jgi:hypothetical protein
LPASEASTPRRRVRPAVWKVLRPHGVAQHDDLVLGAGLEQRRVDRQSFTGSAFTPVPTAGFRGAQAEVQARAAGAVGQFVEVGVSKPWPSAAYRLSVSLAWQTAPSTGVVAL